MKLIWVALLSGALGFGFGYALAGAIAVAKNPPCPPTEEICED